MLTDRDVVRRLKQSVGNLGKVYHSTPEDRKEYWTWTIYKKQDVLALAMLIYPIMGFRRRRKIIQVLEHHGLQPNSLSRAKFTGFEAYDGTYDRGCSK